MLCGPHGQTWLLVTLRSIEAFTAQLGHPTSASVRQPLEDDNPMTRIFERMQPVSNEWSFADRRAEILVFNFGLPKGISVRETFEVPWPVRTK